MHTELDTYMGMKVMVSWAFNGLFELLLLHSGIVSLLTYTPTNIWLNFPLQVLPKQCTFGIHQNAPVHCFNF